MQPFVIPIKGLKAGKNVFEWHLNGEFFGTFENEDILSADVDAAVEVYVSGDDIRVSCSLNGSVTVQCDRCLEDLELPVATSFESEDYDLYGGEIDLSQDLYDYVLISLPMTRTHPDGRCNEETVKYLSK